MGKIDDARKTISMDAKRPGDLVYVLGETLEELGGSEYCISKGFIGNQVPKVNAEKARALYRKVHNAIQQGLVRSCHDCSDGGLGVALAETAFAGGFGMEIDLRKVPQSGLNRNDFLLFSESQSRLVMTIDPIKKKLFETLLGDAIYGEIGVVEDDGIFRARGIHGRTIVEANVDDLKEA